MIGSEGKRNRFSFLNTVVGLTLYGTLFIINPIYHFHYLTTPSYVVLEYVNKLTQPTKKLTRPTFELRAPSKRTSLRPTHECCVQRMGSPSYGLEGIQRMDSVQLWNRKKNVQLWISPSYGLKDVQNGVYCVQQCFMHPTKLKPSSK